MTAEIAIMNKEAIALAADSAVTFIGGNGEKIFTSANKLFALSKYHPVGIMVYGNAIFMGVPWETIIKIYRKKLGYKQFDSLKEYADDFISFLDNDNQLFSESEKDIYIKESISAYFYLIKKIINEKVNSILENDERILIEKVKKIVSDVINDNYDSWIKAPVSSTLQEQHCKEVLKKYKDFIKEAIEEIFEKLPISTNSRKQLIEISGCLFSKFPKDIFKGDSSGVVIAGFGDKDIFPSIRSYIIEGIVINKLKYKEKDIIDINDKNNASIIPFAQSEMVETFMEGIDPFYRMSEESYLSELFNNYAKIVIDKITHYNDSEKQELKDNLVEIGQSLLKDHNEKMKKYIEEKHINPVAIVVSMLPKDELAAMAESLVNLTSFKRKVSMERETVGGPIDVAVISKGDGFIWIKRKHYFKPELNQHFFSNYYKEVLDEKE